MDYTPSVLSLALMIIMFIEWRREKRIIAYFDKEAETLYDSLLLEELPDEKVELKKYILCCEWQLRTLITVERVKIAEKYVKRIAEAKEKYKLNFSE